MSEKIETLEQLQEAAQDKKSVIVKMAEGLDSLGSMKFFSGRLPAAFVINMPGREILRAFKIGLYIYEKGETK